MKNQFRNLMSYSTGQDTQDYCLLLLYSKSGLGFKWIYCRLSVPMKSSPG